MYFEPVQVYGGDIKGEMSGINFLDSHWLNICVSGHLKQ